MEALLKVYFPEGTKIGNDDYETWRKNGADRAALEALEIEEVTWDNRREWLDREGVMAIPYTSSSCYTFSTSGHVLLRHPNGRTTNWKQGEFKAPFWIAECPFEPKGIEGTVHWWCNVPTPDKLDKDDDADELLIHQYKLGDMPEVDGANGTLELEILRDGRRRYKLWVDAPTLKILNSYVAGVRTGDIKPDKPWLD
jgi:hypothetical protein